MSFKLKLTQQDNQMMSREMLEKSETGSVNNQLKMKKLKLKDKKP